MIFGISHVEVPVRDLRRAEVLYRSELGFVEQRRGDGFLDLDGGTTSVRLVETAEVAYPARIRLQVGNVAESLAVASRGGATLLYEPMRTSELEEIGVARDPDGNVLIFWRALSEDEYGFVPPLPTERRWDAEAEALLGRLLSHVPALFRMLARRRVTKVAEELTEEARGRVVGREQVIRAFILASARVTRERARVPLLLNGIDPDRYRADFEA